jgi:GT2 family glycosyltransferase
MTSYLEDIDLGLRIRRAGGSAMFIPEAVVFHHFSGTTGALSPMKARLIERNHTTVAARHLPLDWLIALPYWTLVRWVVLVQTVRRARGSNVHQIGPALHLTAFAVIRGLCEGFARLPRSLGDRRRLKAQAAVRSSDWRHLLRAHRAHARDYRRFGAETLSP